MHHILEKFPDLQPYESDFNLRMDRYYGKLHQLAEALLSGRAGRIYLMTSWTQQMSELGPRAFEEYIQRNGKVVVHS